MPWSKEKLKTRLRVAGFVVLLLGFTAFFVVTDNDDGPSLWQRWTGNSSVRAGESAGTPLRQIGTIDVPGPKGKRFDYLTIDASRHLLFSTHLGAGLLYAVDLRTNKVIKTFEDLPGIEGVELAPDINKAYTSNWLENKIGVRTSVLALKPSLTCGKMKSLQRFISRARPAILDMIQSRSVSM